jgi:hypothetical protein
MTVEKAPEYAGSHLRPSERDTGVLGGFRRLPLIVDGKPSRCQRCAPLASAGEVFRCELDRLRDAEGLADRQRLRLRWQAVEEQCPVAVAVVRQLGE